MQRGCRVVACACVCAGFACVPVPEPPPSATSPGLRPSTSNPAEAVEFAALAGGATVLQQSAREAARSTPPHPTYCGGDYDTECWEGAPQDDGRSYDGELTLAEARSHALMYVNAMRSLNRVDLVELDDALDDFAQEGSEQLARDHRAHGHLKDERARCAGCGECQGAPDGWRPEPVAAQIDEILGAMMAEGPGGGHHDALLSPRWSRMGVGIVGPGGRMYFTVDFAP